MKFTTIFTIAAVAVAVNAKAYNQQITCAAKGFTGKSYDESKVCCEYSGNCGDLSKCTETFCSGSAQPAQPAQPHQAVQPGQNGRSGRAVYSDNTGNSDNSGNTDNSDQTDNSGNSDNSGSNDNSEKSESKDISDNSDTKDNSESSANNDNSKKSAANGNSENPSNADKSGISESADKSGNPEMADNERSDKPEKAVNLGSSGNSSNDFEITCAEKRKLDSDSLEGPIQEDKVCCRWSGECGDLNKCTQSYCEV